MLKHGKWCILFLTLLVLLLPAEAGAARLAHNKPTDEIRASGLSLLPQEILVRWSESNEPDLDYPGAIIEKKRRPGLARVHLPPGISQSKAHQLYSRRSGVLHVQPNYRYQADFIPNDPLYNQQWHLPFIQAPSAWDLTRGSQAVVVAVLDSGVDLNHPDLQANLVPGSNQITGQLSTQYNDDEGHGTAVAGVIAALTDNSLGGAGVAGGVRLMPVKVLDSSGSGSSLDISEGIRWAAEHGARVINLSLGMSYQDVTLPDLILQDAIDYAYQQGALVVASAGNGGQGSDSSVNFPARLQHVVAVGASDQHYQRAAFSSWGEPLDLLAPGVGMITTSRGGTNGYSFSGTSAAAPVVSGVAALLISLYPELSPGQIEQLLEQAALEVGADGWDLETGFGMVQAAAALQAELPSPDPEEPDDSPAAAQLLVLDQWQEGRIATVDDVDYYEVTIPASTSYYLEIDPPATMDAVVDVFDHNINQIATIDIWGVDVTDVGTLQLEAGNAYYFRVSDFNTRWSQELYRLRLATAVEQDDYEPDDSWESARLIASGIPVAATLYPDNDSDWYQVDVGGEGLLQLELQSPEDLDIMIKVYDSQQQELQQSSSSWSGTTLAETVLLPSAGQYYINVAEADGWYSQYPYSLAAIYPDPRGQVAGKVRLQGRLDASGVTVNLAGMSEGTGETGNYLFTSVQPGDYSLEASAPGYARASREVNLPAGGGEIQLALTTLGAGDLDGDGTITSADLNLIAAKYGQPGTTDYDGDGFVSITDLALLARNLRDS